MGSRASLIKPLPELAWYFNDAAADLGFKAQCISGAPSGGYIQSFPTQKQCNAARKQTRIREALRQLSAKLQSILESAYSPCAFGVQLTSEHGLAAGIVARCHSQLRGASPEEKEQLHAIVKAAPMLLMTAHEAYRIAAGKPSSKVEERRRRIESWANQQGLVA